jgi:hypothetical protein
MAFGGQALMTRINTDNFYIRNIGYRLSTGEMINLPGHSRLDRESISVFLAGKEGVDRDNKKGFVENTPLNRWRFQRIHKT